jgi:PAS domain S-box-containing protein
MSNLPRNDLKPDLASFRSKGIGSHRRRRIRVLFVHHDNEVVETCLQELTKGQFAVISDVVLTLGQAAEQVRSRPYDVVVAEYALRSREPQALRLLGQTAQEIPLLFVTTAMASEPLAQLVADGAFDYVEREHLGQLPMAVRRALNEQKLRAELEEAGKALRHSQSLYRALVDNPDYGICQYDARGKILDANQAFLRMLGYSTKAELLAANFACKIPLGLGRRKPLPERSPESVRIEPVETEWKRKDGTTVKTKLGGHAVFDERGNFAGHEIISVDITEQRALEDHLRRQALSDSLTGLANHRRLIRGVAC